MVKLLYCIALTVNDPSFNQIVRNKPSIDRYYAKRVAEYSRYWSYNYGINYKVMNSIMMIESSYRLNITAKNDHGICQINDFNIKAYNFNKYKILNDLNYSIKSGYRVLDWFYSRYKFDEAIMRYNCGTRRSCIKNKDVKKYLKNFYKYYK
jgi:hypothetical protein